MKTLSEQVRPAAVTLILSTLLFGGIYPVLSTFVLQALFPHEAKGSMIVGKDGKVLGSALIGQNFSGPEYFWGRLSATMPYPYNAASSNASNFGANNPALIDEVKGRIKALKAGPHGEGKIPVDLATSSASGLDPHISIAAAKYQIPRVAGARHMPEAKVEELVKRYTEGRQFGILGEPVVNVLELNLALDGKL